MKMINLLLNQMQVIDFVAGLRFELAIITNESNLIDLDEAKKIVKNVKNASLINKNVITATMILIVVKIKELKTQILKLKVELKDSKYMFKEDYKLFLNIKKNRKSLYKGSNCKLIDKRNLKYYK